MLWTWTALLSALVLYPAFYPQWNAAIPIGVAVLAAGLYTFFRPGQRRDATLASGWTAPAAGVGLRRGPGRSWRPDWRRAAADGLEHPGGGSPGGGAGGGGHPGAAKSEPRRSGGEAPRRCAHRAATAAVLPATILRCEDKVNK